MQMSPYFDDFFLSFRNFMIPRSILCLAWKSSLHSYTQRLNFYTLRLKKGEEFPHSDFGKSVLWSLLIRSWLRRQPTPGVGETHP